MKDNWVYEIIHANYPTWVGNLLYNDFGYAKFCAEQDCQETFGEPNASYTWDFICKGIYQLYDGELPTDIELRIRHVNNLDK